MMNKINGNGKWIWPLVGALVCFGLGTASGLSSGGGDSAWYRGLDKPPGTPPGWVFGPVWTVLYGLMGVAVGRLIVGKNFRAAVVFGIQFGLNLLWTPLFFGMHEIGAAMVVILAMWLGIAATILLAWRMDRVAAGLLVPYLIWTSYATYLNGGFYWLNR